MYIYYTGEEADRKRAERPREDFLPEHQFVLNIDGKIIPNFSKLELIQKMQDHHNFELVVDHDVVEVMGASALDLARNWIGKVMHLEFHNNDMASYIGYVRKVDLFTQNGHHGNLKVFGHGQTLALESNKQCNSWVDHTLADIVNNVIAMSHRGLFSEVNPSFTQRIPYECQYDETNFEFLRRLSQQYHQYFYYDGFKIIFGQRPESHQEPLRLQYPNDVMCLNNDLTIKPIKVKPYDYSHATDSHATMVDERPPSDMNELTHYAFDTSRRIFTKEGSFVTTLPKDDLPLVGLSAKKSLQQRASDLEVIEVLVEGCYFLSLGRTVSIIDNYPLGKNTDRMAIDYMEQEFPLFQIIELIHHIDSQGRFQSIFKAIPNGFTVLPLHDKVKYPKAGALYGTVYDNRDPENLGRVQVKTGFHIGDKRSNWIPVATPYGGGSDAMPKNRGFVFIPEIGDTVILNFEQGNPARMYVESGVHSGDTAYSYGEGNPIKTLSGKGGQQIVFDETQDAQKMTLKDKNNNRVVIDTANKGISLKSAGSIQIKSQNVLFNAEEKLVFKAKKATLEASDEMHLSSKGDMLLSGQNYNLKARKSTEIITGKKVYQSNNEVSVSSAEINIHANTTASVGSSLKTSIKGGMLNVGGVSSAPNATISQGIDPKLELLEDNRIYNEFEGAYQATGQQDIAEEQEPKP